MLVRVDDHFAPKQEQLDITYELQNFSGDKVRLEIVGENYGGVLYQRELDAGEKSDGQHVIHWDGKCQSGSLKDHYIHPLFSPFKVHLYYDDTYTGELPFKVLYHSIKLKHGPWTPDEKEPPESDEKAWTQYKLNQLGYFGGPVGNDTEDYLKKAVIRYKANHKKLRKAIYSDYDDDITDDLKKALKANENDRKFPPPAAVEDPGKKSTLYVEALTYERTGATTSEFGGTRPPFEKDRLNRPLVPVEAEIYLKTKADAKALVPEAVGPVRVNWKFTDADEDLSPQYVKTASEPSLTKNFIEKALKLDGGRSGQGDNCPTEFAGIREAAADDWKTPFLSGAFYTPHDVQQDSGAKAVYSTACVDEKGYPKRLGKAGVLLRPSYIAADDYKFRAELDFTGQPNKADLEKLHGITGPDKAIKDETGVFTVRRLGKVAMSVEWPARSNSYDWDKISGEFEKAFNDVDTKGLVTKPIGQVLTEKQYKDLVVANTSHTDPAKIGYYADWLVGVELPAQGNLDADDYKTALKTFTHTDFNSPLQEPLGAQISENVRKEHPSGFVIVSFLLHKPVNIKNDPANGDNTVTNDNKGFVTWGGSIGLADSVILADQKDPDKVYYVVSHEMGHNYYLLHWENTGENNQANHDTDDHNCTMSYSDFDFADPGHYAFQEPGKYTPHFCGKCNLALRGWDITAANMAGKTTKGAARGKRSVNPKITLDRDFVLVNKDGGEPSRVRVALGTDSSFDGVGTFSVDGASDAVEFFTSATKGGKIVFDGKGNVFPGKTLTDGVRLWAQGKRASGSLADKAQLKLSLDGGSKTNGPDATAELTSVELTLDVCDRAATALSAVDKLGTGGEVPVQSADKRRRRVKVIVRPTKPPAFPANLALNSTGTQVRLFADEKPAKDEKPMQLPRTLKKVVAESGLELWAEGADAGDTGLTLGFDGYPGHGDSVKIAVKPPVWPELDVISVQFSGSKRTTVDKDTDGKFDNDWVRGVATKDQSALCYARKSLIELSARFDVTTKPVDPEIVQIRAKADFNGVTLEWKSADPHITVSSVTNTVTLAATDSDKTIPNEVRCYDPMKITWEMTQLDGSWKKFGETSNVLYATLAAPDATAKPYWTLLDISCRAAEGVTDPGVLITKVFDEFKNGHTGDGKGFKRKRDGKELTYYGLAAKTPATDIYTTYDLMHRPDGIGRCGAWARLLVDTYKLHGITTPKVLGVAPVSNSYKELLLVKNMSFTGAGGQAALLESNGIPGIFPYEGNDTNTGECQKQDGIKGQGKTNPQFVFGDHALVEINGKIYDPSYAVGPYNDLKTYVDAGIAGLGSALGNNYVDFTQGDGSYQFMPTYCGKGHIIHKVAGGEDIDAIALLYGVASGTALYNHPYNKLLKTKTGGNPAAITVGDNVIIPREISNINILKPV